MNNEVIVPYVDLAMQWKEIRIEALKSIDETLLTGQYLDHDSVKTLESEISNFLNLNYSVTLNSGTDALVFALKALGIGHDDEVITVPNTYIATVAAIYHVGARPVFVDVGPDHLMDPAGIEVLITMKTKAIIPVHLEGKVCEMDKIMSIAQNYNLKVIEDTAQAIGSKFDSKNAGTFGDIGCFSMHPLKNFNAIGDAGFIVTKNIELATKIRMLANHGQLTRNNSDMFGYVSRLDSLQAAVLLIKMKRLNLVIDQRVLNAQVYDSILDSNLCVKPISSNRIFHTYHLYVVEITNRDLVQEKLRKKGIETKIHYPKLITDQIAYQNHFRNECNIDNAVSQSNRILSLPIHQNLTRAQLEYVAKTLNEIMENVI